jgi:predicted transcriptional regulator
MNNESIKNQINKNLRLKGLNQLHICEILNIKQASVSRKINGKRNWQEWELQELYVNGLIDSI